MLLASSAEPVAACIAFLLSSFVVMACSSTDPAITVWPLAVEATAQLGYPANVMFGLGLLQLACLVVYRETRAGAAAWPAPAPSDH
jgi:hypothetical protein